MLIFDFDGTVADSFQLVVDTFGQVVNRPIPLTEEEIKQLRGMKAEQILKYLGLRRWRIPRLVTYGRRLISEQVENVDTFAGLPEALERLKASGHHMIILSSNDPANISRFLYRHELEGYFDSIHGNVGLFSKAGALKKLVRRQNLVLEDCIYIGDEVRDIEAAAKVGLDIISVAWGFNSRDALLGERPAHLITRPAQLVTVVAALELNRQK